ncbi:MAG: hypothetical protein VX253_14450, partial [Bacteroidota bacterium]|nr:hypothetical protein [Bacteroidota bacterium]
MKLFCTLLLAALLFISGCDVSSKATDEESCTETNMAFVSEVTGDSAVAAGDKLELSVSFPVNNGCGQFNA